MTQSSQEKQGLVVQICRHKGRGDETICEVPVSDIWGIRWSNVSGGIRRRNAGFVLYGSVSYHDYKDKLNCSGRHDYDNNEMKVQIIKSKTQSSPFYDGYKYLEEKAGPKPVTADNRGISDYIKETLAQNGNQMLRGDLRQLVLENFEAKSFESAMRRLTTNGVITQEPRYGYHAKRIVTLVTEG